MASSSSTCKSAATARNPQTPSVASSSKSAAAARNPQTPSVASTSKSAAAARNPRTPSVASFAISVESDSSSPEDLINPSSEASPNSSSSSSKRHGLDTNVNRNLRSAPTCTTNTTDVEIRNRGNTSSVTSRSGRPTPLPPQTPKSNFSLSPVLRSSDEENEASDDAEGFICAPSAAHSHSSFRSSVMRRERLLLEGRAEEEDESHLKDTVLCFVWACGKLGAAYYELETSILHLLPDIEESIPDCTIIRLVFLQVMPRFVVVSSRQDERLLNVLRDLCNEKLTTEGTQSNNEDKDEQNSQDAGEKTQLFILPGKEFVPEHCKQRLQSIRLPYESKTNDAFDHRVFTTSLIPWNNDVMIRAGGALLKFLDRQAIELLHVDLIDGCIPVLDINIFSMEQTVLVDETAWNSLQIFNVDNHPSTLKQGGGTSSSKEGFSIFSLLNHCITPQGTRALRLMLLRPSRNSRMLKRRQDIVQHFMDPKHMDFTQATRECFKCVKSIPKLLYRLSLLHAKVTEWKQLYQSVYHCLLLGQLCAAQPRDIEVFSEISESAKLDVLKFLSQELTRVIDFEESIAKNRLVPKQGFNPELDSKRKQYSCLPEIMAMVAAEEMKNLPDYAPQCCVVYMPEVGYLLGITLWRENLSAEEMQIEGLEFRFNTTDLAYYRSARTKELDIILGDCQVAILEQEAAAMIYLTETVLKHSKLLIKTGELVAELDCLMSLAYAATEYTFCRPTILEAGEQLKIVDGRHALVEVTGRTFTPNSTEFNDDARIVILTGPNASGKSIYLKQVGTIVLMALAGSFVPATSAQIPVFDRICTRIHHTESISSGLSTFMIDISQMSLALRSFTKNSLVIVDEFGKGTTEADGLSLLASSIQEFVNRENDSPTVFISTHFYSVFDYLTLPINVKLQTMSFIIEDNQIVYLFKLQNGRCIESFANLIALTAGIPEKVTDRSKQIQLAVADSSTSHLDSTHILPNNPLSTETMRTIKLAHQFLSLSLKDVKPHEYSSFVQSSFSEFALPKRKSIVVPSPKTPVRTATIINGSNTTTTTNNNTDYHHNDNSDSPSIITGPSTPQHCYGNAMLGDGTSTKASASWIPNNYYSSESSTSPTFSPMRMMSNATSVIESSNRFVAENFAGPATAVSISTSNRYFNSSANNVLFSQGSLDYVGNNNNGRDDDNVDLM